MSLHPADCTVDSVGDGVLAISSRHGCPMCGKRVRIASAHVGRMTRCADCGENYPLDDTTRVAIESQAKEDNVAHLRTQFIDCPNCRRRLELATAHIGQNVTCPECQRDFLANEAKEQAKETPKPAVYKHDPADARRALVFVAIGVGVVAAALTFHSPPDFWRWLGYVGLLVAVYLMNDPITQKWPSRRLVLRLSFAVLAVVAAFVYHSTAAYESSWTSEEGLRYQDSIRRSGDVIYYRSMWTKGYSGHSEGPMTATTKPHGQWKTTIYEPFNVRHQWYWYGNEITEGEWHLRNK